MSRYCNPTIEDGANWAMSMPKCCSHLKLCCCATFCPCVLISRTAKAVEEPPVCCGILCLLGFVSCYAHFRLRGKVRAKYNINGTWGGDCWRSYFCFPCSLVQEIKEVEEREPAQAKTTEEVSSQENYNDILEEEL